MMPRKSTDTEISRGVKILQLLQGHGNTIYTFAWSPDGHTLASPSMDRTIMLWDRKTLRLRRELKGYYPWGSQIAWSPDSAILAAGFGNGAIILIDAESGRKLAEVNKHHDIINSLSWARDGRTLVSSSNDGSPLLWDTKRWRARPLFNQVKETFTKVAWSPDSESLALAYTKTPRAIVWDVANQRQQAALIGHTDQINDLAWSPGGRVIATGSNDGTIRIWQVADGQQLLVLEGHAGALTKIAFSPDGKLLASRSKDGSTRIWLCNTWETVAKLDEAPSFYGALAFHPTEPLLATLGSNDRTIRTLEWELDVLQAIGSATRSRRYANAKVVLVGDSGVGKSGLALVLLGQSFVPTDSTHGRHVWLLESSELDMPAGHHETHEVLLWDLAGQPGYRLIHQLHLTEVAVAVVVFDARSETDPLAGVRHWDRALRQARVVQGSAAPPLKKFLVAARIDRGGVPVSKMRINSLLRELDFDGFFETSAKEGLGVEKLRAAILQAIDWQALPQVHSTELFQRIKDFLIAEKSGRVLSTVEDIYHAFLLSEKVSNPTDVPRLQFETCVGRLESRDLIRQLSFGNLVLLQPEVLDAYASAIVNAARDEPEGMGYILEEDVRDGRFRMPTDERIHNEKQEKLLLIATIESLLHHEIALREQTQNGPVLVFPSHLTRENPDLPDPVGKSVVYSFQGALLNIYATLAVRLSHSGTFRKKEMWKNATSYVAKRGGTCGMFLRQVEEGHGELTLFFDSTAKAETKVQFEEYVSAHLQRRALPNSVRQKRVIVCSGCETPIGELQVKRRQERGFDYINCPVCEARVSITGEQDLTITNTVVIYEMDRVADNKRIHETAISTLQGKIETRDFDVFLCHNKNDAIAVRRIAEQLKKYGILPWLDAEQLRPGLPWQSALEAQISSIKAAAVFIGGNGVGPWQDAEIAALLRQFVGRGCPVIPVILNDTQAAPSLPLFLEGMSWVDFRQTAPNPMEQLIWGITGRRGLASDYSEKMFRDTPNLDPPM